MKVFTNGEEVWVYEPPCEPKRGVVTGKMDGLHAYYVQLHELSATQRKVYTRIYAFPSDREKLQNDMRDDADGLLRYADELEAIS